MDAVAPVPFSSTRAYLLEARYEFLRLLRTPSFSVPCLLFPPVFYLLFGVLLGGKGGPAAATYLLAGYSVFGVMGVALFGFGAKAGILPLHIWLPEAHPAAPSPVSALMSAVMLKTAVYGLLRVTLDLISFPLWWWGVVALALGLTTALFGIVFAMPASAIENTSAYTRFDLGNRVQRCDAGAGTGHIG